MRFLLIAGFAESLINFRGPLMWALRERGFDVHVAAPGLGVTSKLRNKLEALGYIVHDIPMIRTGTNPFADLRTLFALLRLMRKVRPNVVLSYTIKPVIYGSIAAYLAHVPRRFALITGLGYAFQETERRKGLQALAQWLYSLALANVHKVFFQNPDDQALFKKLGLIKKDKPSIVVNGTGVDLINFSVAPLPQVVNFLLIGRLLGSKGVREYVAAAKQVRASYPYTTFSLVGWIDENPDAIHENELQEWINSGIISFLGHMSDVRPAIKSCSVYVLPSYREGTPRTVLEAMAMGRPIITTDAPGCRETVQSGVNGILVPVKSVSGLVNAMQLLIESPDLIASMGDNSRKLAENKYDIHKVNALMLAEMEI